jgi:hypothetical protein
MSGFMPTKCPACGKDMQVCLLQCPACRTEVQGEFLQGPFAGLSETQLSFLEIFLRCRGNLKDLCAAVGISYPTARNRLDQLIEALDSGEKSAASARRLAVLEQIREGRLTPEEALPLLKNP